MPRKQSKKSIQSLDILSVHQVTKLAMTFWVGGTLTVGCVIVPLLFKNLDEITAATIAGQVFNIVAYIGMVSLFMALIELVIDYKLQIFNLRKFWYVAFMETILFINYFAISPIIVNLRTKLTDITNRVFQHTTEFSFWHSVSSLLFLISCVLGVLYILERNYK